MRSKLPWPGMMLPSWLWTLQFHTAVVPLTVEAMNMPPRSCSPLIIIPRPLCDGSFCVQVRLCVITILLSINGISRGYYFDVYVCVCLRIFVSVCTCMSVCVCGDCYICALRMCVKEQGSAEISRTEQNRADKTKRISTNGVLLPGRSCREQVISLELRCGHRRA